MLNVSPMSFRINLNEIPEAGRQFVLSSETGELTSVLEDLIGTRPYKAEFIVRPIGDAYELIGRVSTRVPHVCSQCAEDLELPVDRKFKEILIEELPQEHKAHATHGSQSPDTDSQHTDVATYSGNQFDAGEFLHEQVALGEPLYPECGTKECKERQAENKKFMYVPEVKGHPGFEALKDLKLKN